MKHRNFSRISLATLAVAGVVTNSACRPSTGPTTTIQARAQPSPMTAPQPAVRDAVQTLATSARAVHAYGRAGDLVVVGTSGARVTVAATPDAPGHRPLRGAVVDLRLSDEDNADPLLWWMPGVMDASGAFHAITPTVVERVTCDARTTGVHIQGAWEERTIERFVCPDANGAFSIVTRMLTSLHTGEHMGEELVVGTSPAIIDRLGMTWENEQPTDFVALAEHGIAVHLGTPDTIVRRRPIRIAAEVFPAPIHVWHSGMTVTQTLDLRAGDALDALSMSAGTANARSLQVGYTQGRRMALSITNAEGKPLAVGALGTDASRTITLRRDFGTNLQVRDDRGLSTSVAIPTASGTETPSVSVAAPAAGVLQLRYEGPAHSPIPVHVMIRGIAPTPDPEPTIALPDRAHGNSLYLRRGVGDIYLAPGRYRVTASHGFTWSLSTREVAIVQDPVSVIDELHPAVDTSAYTSGDFHLHSAPSPDSTVSLEARVLSLLCEGVDFAVATDHNRISDFAPSVRALGATELLATMAGNELTAAGRLWGHFNAFPLAVPEGAPEDGVSLYYQQTPATMFSTARAAGARVIQVNHGRMPPNIGYFELTHFDARTGQADAEFANDFNAIEAFNGIWLETPEKVREGLRDMVGVVRRGMRPTATGNSDSHTLLFEEAGYPRTFVRTPPQPIATRGDRVIEALTRGQTTVSSGPLVEITVEGQGPGAMVHPSRPGRAVRGQAGVREYTVRAHVKVSAAAWVPVERVEIWRDDEVVQSYPVRGPARDGVRFERDIVLTVRADATVTAWADAETPLPEVLPYPHARAIGFAGFVYVDADSDGALRVPAGTTVTPPVVAEPVHRH